MVFPEGVGPWSAPRLCACLTPGRRRVPPLTTPSWYAFRPPNCGVWGWHGRTPPLPKSVHTRPGPPHKDTIALHYLVQSFSQVWTWIRVPRSGSTSTSTLCVRCAGIKSARREGGRWEEEIERLSCQALCNNASTVAGLDTRVSALRDRGRASRVVGRRERTQTDGLSV